MHFFTSVANNYLPKARILAKSLKKYRPEDTFILVLSDQVLPDFDLSQEPFDMLWTVYDLKLPVPNVDAWIFTHRVVEICTAVKGQALVDILDLGVEKVVYLDPDIVVFDTLDEIDALLENHSVLLTPHQSVPEENENDIQNNEICSLQHGIYNFGFFAVQNNEEGRAFACWWRDRLLHYCYDDIPHGIFTDQRWGDFVPAFFPNSFILREPNYNVSTWNLTHRNVTQTGDFLFKVNNKPLQFYHFSGFDSGAQKIMLEVYGKEAPALWTLRNWYIKRMDEEGQKELGALPSAFACYSNGKKITDHQRYILRYRADLVEALQGESPFCVSASFCYLDWYLHAGDAVAENPLGPDYKQQYVVLKEQYDQLVARQETLLQEKELEQDERRRADQEREKVQRAMLAIQNSHSWKSTAWLRWFMQKLRK